MPFPAADLDFPVRLLPTCMSPTYSETLASTTNLDQICFIFACFVLNVELGHWTQIHKIIHRNAASNANKNGVVNISSLTLHFFMFVQIHSANTYSPPLLTLFTCKCRSFHNIQLF